MVTFDCATEHSDGVTLVTVVLSDLAEPTRVTVANRLDGPVWPPRRQGVPEAGWDDEGFDGVIGPGTRALGYATPAPPADQPAELVETAPAPDGETVDDRLATTGAVLRELGDPSPPADAVPAVDIETADTSARPTRQTEPTGAHVSEKPPSTAVPDDVSRWLTTVARRVAHAEGLAAADSVQTATEAVRDAGGMAGVRAVAARAESDERSLRALARRADRLADRRAAATVPIDTLRRLA